MVYYEMVALDFVWVTFALDINDKGTPSLEVKVMGLDRGDWIADS